MICYDCAGDFCEWAGARSELDGEWRCTDCLDALAEDLEAEESADRAADGPEVRAVLQEPCLRASLEFQRATDWRRK